MHTCSQQLMVLGWLSTVFRPGTGYEAFWDAAGGDPVDDQLPKYNSSNLAEV